MESKVKILDTENVIKYSIYATSNDVIEYSIYATSNEYEKLLAIQSKPEYKIWFIAYNTE